MNNIRKYYGEPLNIYESLSPLYYILKLFGLASYNLNFKNGKMKTSPVHYIMTLGFIALYILLIWNFFQVDASTYSPEGKLLLIYGLVFVYSFQYMTNLLILIHNFLKRRNVEKLLKLLETFDDHIEKLRWKFKINHEQNYWSSIFWIVLSFILLTGVATIQVLWVANFDHNFKDYLDMFIYSMITEALVLSSFQFIFGVHSVSSRFEILNKNTK